MEDGLHSSQQPSQFLDRRDRFIARMEGIALTWFAEAFPRQARLTCSRSLPSSVKASFPACDSLSSAVHDWLMSECSSAFFQDVDNRVQLMNVFHILYPDVWAEHASTPGRAAALSGALLSELKFCAAHVLHAYQTFYSDQTDTPPSAVTSSSKRHAKRACNSGTVLALRRGGRG